MSVIVPGFKVMVVDDSQTVRVATEALLKQEQCEVLCVNNGFEALVNIKKFEPDVILMDVMMPRLDGYQTATVIKNNLQYQDTPIIFLSSKDGVFDKAKARICGATEYITKPFSKEELLTELVKHLVLKGA
jgi:twitching motility two-component system response regulator PilG